MNKRSGRRRIIVGIEFQHVLPLLFIHLDFGLSGNIWGWVGLCRVGLYPNLSKQKKTKKMKFSCASFVEFVLLVLLLDKASTQQQIDKKKKKGKEEQREKSSTYYLEKRNREKKEKSFIYSQVFSNDNWSKEQELFIISGLTIWKFIFTLEINFQVCCSGHGKNGALCVLRQSIRPEMITEVCPFSEFLLYFP